MKVYKVKVNNKTYVVELESVDEVAGSVIPDPKATTPVKSTAEDKPTPRVVLPADGTKVKAPMQGVIIKVKVNLGDHVNKGDTVVVLEAMKMENDIVSPVSGVVQAILVENGQNVDNQADLVVIG